MKTLDKIYIDGAFVTPHGTQRLALFSPMTDTQVAEVTLGDAVDTQRAIAAAKAALVNFSQTSREDRIGWLEKIHAALSKRNSKRQDDFEQSLVEAHGETALLECFQRRVAIQIINLPQLAEPSGVELAGLQIGDACHRNQNQVARIDLRIDVTKIGIAVFQSDDDRHCAVGRVEFDLSLRLGSWHGVELGWHGGGRGRRILPVATGGQDHRGVLSVSGLRIQRG